MKNTKRILSLIIVMALLLTMMAVPAVAKDSNTNETDIIGSLYLSATPTTITVRGATSSYSFRIDDSTTWTTNATFSGLYPNTEHTVYAKLGSAPEITVGKITTKAADYIANPNATSIDAAAPNILPSLGLSVNVNFQESLSLLYYIPVANLSGYKNVRFYVQKERYEEYATSCTYDDRIVDVLSLPTEVQSTTGALRYLFRYTNIAAAQLGEVVYITIYAEKDGITYVSPLYPYSIAKYCYNNLAKTNVSTTMKAVLVNLLNYGAAAQTYFHRNTANLVNSDLTAAQQALANSSTYNDWNNCKNSTGSGDAKISSVNVNFGNTTKLIYYATLPASYDLSKVTLEATYTSSVASLGNRKITVKGSAFEWDASKNRYNVVVSGIATTDYGCPVKAVIKYNGSVVSNEVTYSIETYCKTNATPTASVSADMKTLATMLMKYSYASRAHFK